MSRRSNRRARRSDGDSTKLLLGSLFLLLIICIAIVFFSYQFFFKEEIVYDKATACRITDGRVTPIGHTVVFIDGTDPLSIQQKDFLDVSLRNYIDNELLPEELISIYFLGNDLNINRRPVFEMCKIRDGSDADYWTENAKLMHKRFQQKFDGPLQYELNLLKEQKDTANYSPIMEMIQSISVNAFDKWNVDGSRKLLMYTDALHHTKNFSLYKSMNYDGFKRSSYARTISTRLPGVEVYLYAFNTNSKYHTNALTLFWQKFFKDREAMLVSSVSVGR